MLRFSTVFRLFWLLLALLLSGGAHAYGTNQCPGSRFGSDLNCTANDVNITAMQVVSGPASCTGGEYITVDLKVTLNFASPDRWDVGVFLSQDGKNPQLTTANGGSNNCKVSILPTTSPFLNLDPGPWSGVTDTCGDGNSGINGGTGSGDLYIYGVQVNCQSMGANGLLYIPFVVSWDNQSSPSGSTCTSIADPVPNTKSKCNAPTIAQGSVAVVVLPAITKTASSFNGDGSISPGDTVTYTISVANRTSQTLSTTSGNAAVLKDPNVSNLTFSSISCAVTAGTGTCPTSPTIAALTGTGITIPSISNASTMTFTLQATLSGNPTGTLTNVAYVTSNGQTNTATSSLSIVYPLLVNQKTVTTLSDPINGTVNPKNIPGAEVEYTITLTNQGKGRPDINTVKVVDTIPNHLEFYAGDYAGSGLGPLIFSQGSPASSLTYTYSSLGSTTDNLEFSNNSGSTYVYTPTSGYDSTVSGIRVSPQGRMARWSGTGSYPSFSLKFKARVK